MAIGLFSAVLVVLLYIWVSLHLGDRLGKDRHIRGSKVTQKKHLIKLVKEHNRARRRILKDMPPSYGISYVDFPLGTENTHLCLIGSTGVGKTQALTDILSQIKQFSDRAVIYDKMGSFPPRFYDPKTDILLNPLDVRCPAWDIFADARTLVDWTAIGTIIFPEDPKVPYFSIAAIQVFSISAIRYQEDCEKKQKRPKMSGFIHMLVNTTDTELHELLLGTTAGKHIDPAAQSQTAGVMGTISNGMRSFGYLKDTEEGQKSFSIREWVSDEDREGMVFLTSRSDHHAALRPLLTMWMAIFVNAVQSQSRSNQRRIWFFLDELPSLGRLDVLESALAEARQFGACFVLGIQAISQLRTIYGADGADTVLALTRTKLIFNPGDDKTAEVCSTIIGHREINSKSTNFSMGRNAIRDGQGVQESSQTEKVVLAEELTQLPDLTAILCFPGAFPVAEVSFQYLSLEGKQPPFVEDPLWVNRVNTLYSDDYSSKVRRERFKQNMESFHSERDPHYGDSLTGQEEENTTLEIVQTGGISSQPQTDETHSQNHVMPKTEGDRIDEESYKEGLTRVSSRLKLHGKQKAEAPKGDHRVNGLLSPEQLLYRSENEHIRPKPKPNSNANPKIMQTTIDPISGIVYEEGEVPEENETYDPRFHLLMLNKEDVKDESPKPKSSESGGHKLDHTTAPGFGEGVECETMPYDTGYATIKTRGGIGVAKGLTRSSRIIQPAVETENPEKIINRGDLGCDV